MKSSLNVLPGSISLAGMATLSINGRYRARTCDPQLVELVL
jgi:hypothetical protein